MEKFLADTSAWIASFYRIGHEPLKNLMREKILCGELVTTGMVALELLRGSKNQEQFASLQKKLSVIPFLSVDHTIWAEVAQLSLNLRLKGLQVSVPDLFISHVAMRNHCTLIHCDGDFEKIAKQTSLKTMPYNAA